MQILLINNDGAGFADYVDINAETTVAQLFGQRMGPARPSDYLIRVNRQPCPADQVLQEGDRISITPTKIEGAERGPRFVRSQSGSGVRQLSGHILG